MMSLLGYAKKRVEPVGNNALDLTSVPVPAPALDPNPSLKPPLLPQLKPQQLYSCSGFIRFWPLFFVYAASPSSINYL